VFNIHSLASSPAHSLEARRDILVEAIIGSADSARSTVGDSRESLENMDAAIGDSAATAVVTGLVTGELARCWDPATDVLRALRPDLVVVADYREAGAGLLLESKFPGTPVAVVPLGTDLDAMVFPAFSSLFERASATLVFTEAEMDALNAAHGSNEPTAFNVGLPLSANPSVLREPNAYLGECDYVLVVTGCYEESPERSAGLARLLRARFARRNIAVVATDSFTVWVQGIADRPHAVERGSDLLRLMAWALATVDLRPGSLFARRSVESLLYSTPIVVPHRSRAAEHAAAGGGLWFDDAADLEWCVETMFDHTVSGALGEQGRSYAEERYGSTGAFVEKVASATGLKGLVAQSDAPSEPLRTGQ